MERLEVSSDTELESKLKSELMTADLSLEDNKEGTGGQASIGPFSASGRQERGQLRELRKHYNESKASELSEADARSLMILSASKSILDTYIQCVSLKQPKNTYFESEVVFSGDKYFDFIVRFIPQPKQAEATVESFVVRDADCKPLHRDLAPGGFIRIGGIVQSCERTGEHPFISINTDTGPISAPIQFGSELAISPTKTNVPSDNKQKGAESLSASQYSVRTLSGVGILNLSTSCGTEHEHGYICSENPSVPTRVVYNFRDNDLHLSDGLYELEIEYASVQSIPGVALHINNEPQQLLDFPATGGIGMDARNKIRTRIEFLGGRADLIMDRGGEIPHIRGFTFRRVNQ